MTARLAFVLACAAAMGCRGPATAPDVDAAPTAIFLGEDLTPLDPTFGTDGWIGFPGTVTAIALQRDQKVLLCGPGLVMRLRPNGSLDPTFGAGGMVPIVESACRRIAVLADDRVVIAGAGVNVLSTDGVVLDRPSTLPTHSGLSVMPMTDGGFVVAGTQVYLQGFSMMWRIALVRYTPSMLPSPGFGLDGVALNAVPNALDYNLVGLALANDPNGAQHLLVSYSSGVRAVTPASGALDGTYVASPPTQSAGIAITARGPRAFGAYTRSGQVWSFAVDGANTPPVMIDVAYATPQPFVLDTPTIVQDSALRPIVVRARGPVDTVDVHPVRLTTGPLAVDAAWTTAHTFTLPAWCGHAPPCESPPLDVRTTRVAGAVITADDRLVIAGVQTSSVGGDRAFVARLRP